MNVAGFTMNQRQAELQAANLSIEKRLVRAQTDGVVAKIERHENEYVQEGQPILRLIQMARLKVKGAFDVTKYSPASIRGKPATVQVDFAYGPQTFQGRVVEIAAEASQNSVEAVVEVQNVFENNEWVLRPGMVVDMTIHVGGAAAAPLGAVNNGDYF